MRWNNWLLLVLAFWLFVSPWLLGFSEFNLVVWNNILVGGLIVIFTFWNIAPPRP
jgi:hypothetical protein